MWKESIDRNFFILALILMIVGLNFGVLAVHSYTNPGLWKESLGFVKLRPLHVSTMLFWILTGATGAVFYGLKNLGLPIRYPQLSRLQLLLWVIAIAGVFYSYFNGKFGGREYWEFPKEWSLFILAAWLLMVVNYFSSIWKLKSPPVYIWMWGTGIAFFLFIFIENYLWVIPYFRENFIRDTIVQWKVNGSLVGCWNQMIYGSAIYLMERISGDKSVAKSKLTFGMYFLGLFNLMFNWSHHIYTLPTAPYIRYIGYAVSMTEWVILLRIISNFKASLSESRKHLHYYSYRFLLAADLWVFLNLFMALLMSIPAINLYTHGTHITVAHAMGTTIGINTMILLAVIFDAVYVQNVDSKISGWLRSWFYLLQLSLLVFWISLIGAGVKKAIIQMQEVDVPHSKMMLQLQPWFHVFSWSGAFLLLALAALSIILVKRLLISKRT